MKTKKQLTNRILGLVLTLVMVLGMVPMTSFTALALSPLQQDSDGYYLIADESDLFAFSDLVNNGETSANAKLTKDITISEGRVWTPIGASDENVYKGSFDGQEYTISNLHYNNNNGFGYAGLFGTISGGTVKDVTVANSSFTAQNAGAIAGECDAGTISGCGNLNTTVSGYFVGGIVGAMRGSGTILACWNNGTVSGSLWAGGICSVLQGTVKGCWNTGEVNAAAQTGGIVGWVTGGDTVAYCYNEGPVSGSLSNGGAIIGGHDNSPPAMSNCYYTLPSDSQVKKAYGKGADSEYSNVRNVGDSMLSTGGVAHLLNQGLTGTGYQFYQNLGENGDRTPVLDNTHGIVFAGYTACSDTLYYSNDESAFSETKYHSDIEYMANGGTIKEVCTNTNCTVSEGLGNATLNASDATYNGSAITTGASITYSEDWHGEKPQPAEGDYSNNVNAGTATVKTTVEGQEVTTTFQIKKAEITEEMVTLSPENGTYNGSVYTPNVSVAFNGTPLVQGTHYTVSWDKDGFTAPDTYTVRVVGTGNFTGYVDKSFKINAVDLSNVKVEQVGTLTYNGGEALTPTVSANAVAVNDQPITFTYSTAEDGTYGTMPSFEKAGTYTVYFKATAPNHNEATGSFTVTVDKAVVNVPTIESKPYTDETQTADVPASDLYTVKENNGGIGVLENGKGYNVVLKLNDPDNYKWSSTDEAEVTLSFKITRAANEWEQTPSIEGWTYGETAKVPVGTAKFGDVSVEYSGTANDGTSYISTVAPTKAGNYTAAFIVAETENYSGLETSVAFAIAKATYDMTGAKWDYEEAIKYDGKAHSVWVDEDSLPSGVTVSRYTGNTHSDVGRYTANVSLNYDYDNYNTPAFNYLLDWEIVNDWTPTEYAVSGEGWMNQDFVITPADGYLISLTNTANGTWEEALTYRGETDNGSVTFYLKNEADGTISRVKTVSYKLDKTAPTGKVAFDERNGWEEFLNTITFGLFYKDEVTVQVKANDTLSGIAKIEYAFSGKAMTLDEVKAITDWTEYNGEFGVTLEDAKKFVYCVRITDNAGNVTYLSTDGAEYDTAAPVIEGIENGKTYYTTQRFTVKESNLESVTVNGNPSMTFALGGNVDKEYVIIATDKAGNTTTVTVTMKPIKELAKATENLGSDNVTSDDAPALRDLVDKLDELIADPDTSDDGEKETLQQHKVIAESLLDATDDIKAEITRINEELNKFNGDTVNSDDAPALEQLAKDIKELLDGDNLTDAERTALTADAGKVADMQKTVADTTTENKRISDAVDSYDLATVTSDDKADIEQLLKDIEKQLESTNLTEEEISELNGDKKAVEDLLTKIKGTDELIDKLTGDVDGYSGDTVKSTDKDAIEQIIEDIDALLETENPTDAEKKALEDAKTKAEGLLDTIEDATEATTSENTEKVKDVTAENVTPENKADLEKAKEDLEKALQDNGGNYTDDEKKSIEDEIKRIDDALEVIGNVEEVEEFIGKLPENIKKNDEDAIKAADEAYNALTDYEKSLVDEDAKKALDDAKAALAELKKPADPNSPATGDNSHMMLWIALLFISGGAVITLTVVDRKRRTASKR